MSVFEQAKKNISSYVIELYFGGDGSYWDRGEFWTRNPLRIDTNIGSFSISEQGFYQDFAFPGQYEGDFIDLVSKVFGLSTKEAAEKIIQDTGGIIDTPRMDQKKSQKKEKKEKIGIKIDPVKNIKYGQAFGKKLKEDYFLKDKQSDNWKPVKAYKYFEYDSDNILFYIVRYETEIDGKIEKKFHPFHLNENEHPWAGLPNNFKPYPLYNINSIVGNDNPVIIVEGEKCGDVKVSGYNIVAIGASSSFGSFDFSMLKKRDVYIWPDNDEPGISAARKIKEKCCKNAIILNIPKDKPEKWDIADAENDEINITELIEQMKPKKEIIEVDEQIEFDPEFAADMFLDERYNYHNLDQIDGIYWRYLQDRHFWERIDWNNIKSDIQIFLKQKGFFQYAKSIYKSKVSFKNNVTSLVKDHSQGYYENNPFKESAIQPYINLKNGVLHIKDSGFEFISRDSQDEEFFRKLYPVNCFDFSYNPKNTEKINYLNIEKYAPTFHYYAKSIVPKDNCTDEEIFMTLKFICQMIAYCISPLKKRPYFFSFYGDEDTAKSSLFYLVREFIGDDFTVNRSVSELENRPFASSDLWGAKLFVDEDMQENSMIPAGFVKKYSGNQTITIERKNENSQHGVKISVAMFFISNYKLRAHGIEGLKRRAIIAKFVNKVPENADAEIMQRLSGKKPHNYLTPEFSGQTFDEREYIIHLIMQEWENMSKNGYRIDLPNWVRKSTDNLLSEMTSVNEYLKELAAGERYGFPANSIQTIDELWKDYSDWCKDQGRKAKGKNKFEEEIRRDVLRIDCSARLPNRRKGVYRILEYEYEGSEKIENDVYDNEIDFEGSIPF